MRSVPYTLGEETYAAQCAAHRHNSATTCNFRDRMGRHTIVIECGTDDFIEVYREGPITFVVGRHYGLGYVSLQAYEGDDLMGEVFLQSTEQVDELLGRGGIDRSGWWIAKVLANYALDS